MTYRTAVSYPIVVGWDSVDDRVTGVRSSDDFQKGRLVSSFFEQAPNLHPIDTELHGFQGQLI